MKQVRRYDYIARRLAIQKLWNVQDEAKEMARLYHQEGMGSYEIAEGLQKAGITINARSVLRIVKEISGTRTKGDAFRLAGKRGRIHWALKDPRFKTRQTNLSKVLRYQVMKRDGFKCVLCGVDATTALLEIDHKVARVHGGDDSQENLRTLCHDCNEGKRVIEKER